MRVKVTDEKFTIEAAKAEGVNDALGDIEALFAEVRKQED